MDRIYRPSLLDPKADQDGNLSEMFSRPDQLWNSILWGVLSVINSSSRTPATTNLPSGVMGGIIAVVRGGDGSITKDDSYYQLGLSIITTMCCRHRNRILAPPVTPIWPHKRGTEEYKTRTTSNSQKPAISMILQSTCLLFKLPRELRDTIYSHLLPSCITLNFAAQTWVENAAGNFFGIRNDMSQYSLTVLALCQQIRAEASALLYGTNHFQFSIGYSPGPSPFNTARALPQLGIKQIKECTIRIFASTMSMSTEQNVRMTSDWLNEVCTLLSQGGNLQKIEIELSVLFALTSSLDLGNFGVVLKPLMRLRGLKSATVTGPVTDACCIKLKKMMESTGIRSRKREVDNVGSVMQPKKRRKIQN